MTIDVAKKGPNQRIPRAICALVGAIALAGTLAVSGATSGTMAVLTFDVIGDAGNEPSIAVDPSAPNRMVAGWRQFDSISSNFRQAGNAYTTNGGQGWRFLGSLTPGIFRSDPVLGFDSSGVVYYHSLVETFDRSPGPHPGDKYVDHRRSHRC